MSGRQGGNALRRVMGRQNAPPQPQQREFFLYNLVSPQLTGSPIGPHTLCVQYATGPNNVPWFYNYNSNELVLGNNAIQIVAPATRGWLERRLTITIQGVRAQVALGWSPKAAWGLHELVTVEMLKALEDRSTLTHVHRPNIRVVEPANGIFTAPGDKVTVKIEIVQDDYFAAVTKAVDVKVAKQTPTIKWKTPLPVVVNAKLTSGHLNATTIPACRAAVVPVLVYDPALNAQVTKVGTVQLKASFGGSGWFNAAADATVTLKVVADVAAQGREAMLSGQAWKGPDNRAAEQLLNRWNTDNSKTGIKAQAKKVMADVQSLTGDEMEAYMDKLINPGGSAPAIGTRTDQPGTFKNIIWEMPNGLQVRYKPDGDGQQPPGMPPIPMFCIEGKTCAGPSRNKRQVGFKVTSAGEPAAYGPKETDVPPGMSTNKNDSDNQAYMKATIETTHLACRPKIEQVITWSNPADITVGSKLGKASLNATATDATVLVYKDGAGTVITEDTVLKAGKGQTLEVSATVTKKFLASSKPVKVTINVNKKVQTITWAKPADIPVGTKLGGVLNATSNAAGAVISYVDKDNKPITGDTQLPIGNGQVLKATATATDEYEAVTTPVTVQINVTGQAGART